MLRSDAADSGIVQVAGPRRAWRDVPLGLCSGTQSTCSSGCRRRTRYVAGADARFVKALRWMLPDRALDYFVQLRLSAESRSAPPKQIAP